MHVRIMIVIVMVFFLAIGSSLIFGAPPPAVVRAAHADKNRDGVVTRRELIKEKRFEHNQKAKVDTKWEKKADLDHDGKVEWQEYRVFRRDIIDVNNNGIIEPAERIAFWKNRRAVVNTPLEKKHDLNGDGYITWNEARELLKDIHTIIRTHGKARVDSLIEQEFDINKDGVIDGAEADALLAAISN